MPAVAELEDGGDLCQSLTDVIEWPSQFIKLLPTEGANLMKKTFEQGVLVTSHYSGVASVESMLEYLCEACKENGAENWSGLRMYSASDINPLCRVTLAEHGGPEHIFGDLVAFWDAATCVRLTKAEKLLQQSAEAIPAELLSDVWVKALEDAVQNGRLLEKGWCYKHQRLCKLHTSRPPKWLSLNCAGSTCIDFSNMGARRREQGGSMIPFVCWRAERKHRAAIDEEDLSFVGAWERGFGENTIQSHGAWLLLHLDHERSEDHSALLLDVCREL